MVVNDTDDDERFLPACVLKEISSTSMHVNNLAGENKPLTITELITAQGDVAIYQQGSKQIVQKT